MDMSQLVAPALKPQVKYVIRPTITPQNAFEVIANTALRNEDFSLDDFEAVYTTYAEQKRWNHEISKNTVMAAIYANADSLFSIRYLDTIGAKSGTLYRLNERGQNAIETGQNVWNMRVQTDISADITRKGSSILHELSISLGRFKTSALVAGEIAELAVKLSRSLPDIFLSDGPESACAKMHKIVEHLSTMRDGKIHSEQYSSEVKRIWAAINSTIADFEKLYTIRTFHSRAFIISFSVPTSGISAIAYGLDGERLQRIIEECLKACNYPESFVIDEASPVSYGQHCCHLEVCGQSVCAVLFETNDRIATFAITDVRLNEEELDSKEDSQSSASRASVREAITAMRESLVAYNSTIAMGIYHKYVLSLIPGINSILEDLGGDVIRCDEAITRLQSLETNLREDNATELQAQNMSGQMRSKVVDTLFEIFNQTVTDLAQRFASAG